MNDSSTELVTQGPMEGEDVVDAVEKAKEVLDTKPEFGSLNGQADTTKSDESSLGLPDSLTTPVSTTTTESTVEVPTTTAPPVPTTEIVTTTESTVEVPTTTAPPVSTSEIVTTTTVPEMATVVPITSASGTNPAPAPTFTPDPPFPPAA